MLSRIPFAMRTTTYLLRAPSLSVLELFPGHVLQLNRRHHREYCTSTPPPRRRRRRRVRRRPVVVFEDILLVACSKAGRNAYGRIIRRRRVALRRRTLRDVGVVTRRPRQKSGSRQRGFRGREEDHRSGLSFKASLSKRTSFLSKTRGVSPLFFLLPKP